MNLLRPYISAKYGIHTIKNIIPTKKQAPSAPTWDLGVQSKSNLSTQLTMYSSSVTTGL